jgi:hypothetical protein
MRRGELRPLACLAASFATALLLAGLGMAGGYAYGLLREPRLLNTPIKGDVRGEHLAVGIAVAGVVWLALLAWLWRPAVRLRRRSFTPESRRAWVRPVFVGAIVGAVLTIASYVIGRQPWDDRSLAILAVSLAGAGVAALAWLPAIVGMEHGQAVAGRDGTVRVRCPRCGYPMTGLGRTSCPECGAEFTIDELIRAQGYAEAAAAGGPHLVMVAGPYSAPTAEARAANLAAMNEAARAVYARGYVPVIGMNNALPVLDGEPPEYEDIMRISLALADRCDGVLLLDPSPGADREADRIEARGMPVWRSIDEMPEVSREGE